MRAWAAMGALVVAGAGCRSNAGEPADPLPGSAGNITSTLPYPTDGLGTSEGQVIENFCFHGYVNFVESKATTEICLGHFYNPDGDGVFAAGDPFDAGTAKPTLLVIDISGLWCGPCKQEALQDLPGVWSDLHPKGLMVMTAIVEGKSGVPATAADLVTWDNLTQPRYPTVVKTSKSENLSAFYSAMGPLPATVVVHTRSMKISHKGTGKPEKTFWDAIAAQL
jgi:hypothetical protein